MFEDKWYLHFGLSVIGAICACYTIASVAPFWIAVLLGSAIVAGVAVLKEYWWDNAPSICDIVWDGLGVGLGIWISTLLHGIILADSYGVPWMALFGIIWMVLNLAGLVPPMKRGK